MKLFHRKIGSGMPLVILHGLYGSSDNWMSIARSLAADFEVYLVDQRNHGRSPHGNRHDYAVMRDDLVEFMDSQQLEKVILAGHSMGGKTAMCFAGHHSPRIEKLIIIDIAPKSYKELYRKEAINHYDIIKAMHNVDLPSASSRRDIDRMLARDIPARRIRSFLMKNLERTEDNKYRWTLNLDVLLRELDNIMDGMGHECFDPARPLNDKPVLFVRGEKSPYLQDTDMGFIRQIFPTAKLETIPDAGHWLHAENPDVFVEVVRNFARE